jgi:probable DNA metabolism protein
MDYLYDGTFEGALSGVYVMFYDRKPEEDQRLLEQQFYQADCLIPSKVVETDAVRAEKVARSIIKHFGVRGFRLVTTAYLAENKEYGTHLFRFLKHAYRIGEGAVDCLSDDAVLTLYKHYNSVTREVHRFLGFVRFSELENGVLYAQCEPTYNLLSLMVPHFTERLGNQTWVIHDTKRRMAAFFDQNTVEIKPLESVDGIRLSEWETSYRSLWQGYYDSAAIESRKSDKRQRQMMPKKYWKFLIENPQNQQSAYK